MSTTFSNTWCNQPSERCRFPRLFLRCTENIFFLKSSHFMRAFMVITSITVRFEYSSFPHTKVVQHRGVHGNKSTLNVQPKGNFSTGSARGGLLSLWNPQVSSACGSRTPSRTRQLCVRFQRPLLPYDGSPPGRSTYIGRPHAITPRATRSRKRSFPIFSKPRGKLPPPLSTSPVRAIPASRCGWWFCLRHYLFASSAAFR